MKEEKKWGNFAVINRKECQIVCFIVWLTLKAKLIYPNLCISDVFILMSTFAFCSAFAMQINSEITCECSLDLKVFTNCWGNQHYIDTIFIVVHKSLSNVMVDDFLILTSINNALPLIIQQWSIIKYSVECCYTYKMFLRIQSLMHPTFSI